MNKILYGALLLFCAAGFMVFGCGDKPNTGTTTQAKVEDYTISGPYTHQNLSIYLIHGEDKIKGDKFITLKEGLDAKVVVIHETGNVHELSIENLSDTPLFIQSGEIIRGGKQDRICPYDLVIAPKSGKKPLDSFCVESGRWTQRGGENVDKFESSENMATNNALKVAALEKNDQSEVWHQVTESQSNLSGNIGRAVISKQSSSSMELTLSSEEVQKAIEGRLEALSKLPEGKNDVIGYAYAINGKVMGVDIYGNNHLFLKLWPKLIKASAIESISELQEGKQFDVPEPQAVASFMTKSREAAKEMEKMKSDISCQFLYIAPSAVSARMYYEDADGDVKPVHDTYINKEEEKEE